MYSKRIKSHHGAMAETDNLVKRHIYLHDYLNDQNLEGKKSVIYIHVPFCLKTCTFCSMNRSQVAPPEDYHRLILKEIQMYSKFSYIEKSTFDAVYFGGGTPTTLRSDALREIIVAVKDNFNLTPDAEITIETSVTELSDDKIELFKQTGVNRFSIGVQTFSDMGRKIFNRRGSGEWVKERLKFLKRMNFASVNIDIIYSYPGQSLEELRKDLRTIYELDLDGFSMYSLMNMPASKIKKEVSEETDLKNFMCILKMSRDNGYDFLELTKMVKRDKYKYIVNRNNGEDTLPLGAGAGGNFGNALIMNPVAIQAYEESVKNFNSRKVVEMHPIYKEFVILKGAIQHGKIPLKNALLQKNDKIKHFMQYLTSSGLAVFSGDSLILTDRGFYWGNNISRRISEIVLESITVNVR